jgi:hypothetical protein
MDCGLCGEELDAAEECPCPGSDYCVCEFERHHAGCCDSLDEMMECIEKDRPGMTDDEWEKVPDLIPDAVWAAHKRH